MKSSIDRCAVKKSELGRGFYCKDVRYDVKNKSAIETVGHKPTPVEIGHHTFSIGVALRSKATGESSTK